jgi:hypothetical protein
MHRAAALAVVTLATACGGGVTVESAGAGSGGADAGSGGGGSGGATPACADPGVFFDVTGDGDMLHETANCGPIGRVVEDGSVPPSATVDIASCTNGTAGRSVEVFAHAAQWPGAAQTATVRYFRDGSSWAANGTVALTSFGPVAGVIAGSYQGNLVRDLGSAPPDQISLSGSFRVCRGSDEPGGL